MLYVVTSNHEMVSLLHVYFIIKDIRLSVKVMRYINTTSEMHL